METCGININGSANLNEPIYLPPIKDAKYIKLKSLSLYNSFHNVCSENSNDCVVTISQHIGTIELWGPKHTMSIPPFKNGLYNLDDIEDEINDFIEKTYDRGYRFIFKIDKSTGCLTIREVKPRGVNYSLYISFGSKLRELLGIGEEARIIKIPFTAENKLKLFPPNLYLHCNIVDTSKNLFISNDGQVRYKQVIAELPFTEKDIGNRRYSIHHFNPNTIVPCVSSFNSLTFNITDSNFKDVDFNGYPIYFKLSIVF